MTTSEIRLLRQHRAHEHCAGGLACCWIFLGKLSSRKSSALTKVANESWQSHSKGFVALLEQADKFRGIRSDPLLVKLSVTLAGLQLQTSMAQLCRVNGREEQICYPQ